MDPYNKDANPSPLFIAACMFSDEPDTSNLNQELAYLIKKVNRKCEKAGGALRSRQVVAQIITQWELQNPNKKAYVSN